MTYYVIHVFEYGIKIFSCNLLIENDFPRHISVVNLHYIIISYVPCSNYNNVPRNIKIDEVVLSEMYLKICHKLKFNKLLHLLWYVHATFLVGGILNISIRIWGLLGYNHLLMIRLVISNFLEVINSAHNFHMWRNIS